MERTKKIGMKWYNYLVHFWLPLNIFLQLLLIILAGRSLYPAITALLSFEYEVDPSQMESFLFLLYAVLFVCILPFFVTIGARRSLRKLKPDALGNLTFWYILPVLNFILFDIVLRLSGGEMPFELMNVCGFLIFRALFMIILNKIYFDNRAVLFGLPQKNAPKKQEEAPQAPAEIPQAPEQTPPAPTKSKKATPKKRRKNPGKLLRRATRKIILLDKDYSLPF